jgi:chromosome segregation ATPase
MKREEVQNRLAKITAGMSKEGRGKVEMLAWELFHFAQDSAGGRDETTAAKRALEEQVGDLRQQLTNYKLLTEALQNVWQKVKKEREVMRRQLSDYEQQVKQLEADLDRAKRDKEVMREKLDEWCRALNREEKMAARQQ